MGSGKIKELEADNRSLQNEIAAREESIEDLPGRSATATGTVRQGTCHGADRLHPKTGKGKGADGISAKMDGSCVRMVPAFRRRDAHGGYCRSASFTPSRRTGFFHLPAVGIRRKPLLRRAQEKPLRDGRHRTDGDRAGEKGKRFVLRINGKNILDWFREQFEGCSDGYGQRYSNRNGKTKGFKL